MATEPSTSPLFYKRDLALTRRNEVYLHILYLGLLRIRGAGYQGDHRHCDVEADHLHNVPSYVAGGDAANHLYYLTKEVPYYCWKIDKKVEANIDQLKMYVPLWRELETLVPVVGSPWEQEWRELKAGGWDYAGIGVTAATSAPPRVTSLAPQFLVDDLARSIAYYRKLGFVFDEPWDGFYAIGRIDGLELHLKHAPANASERKHRRDNEHLDASAGVDGIEAFYRRCVANQITILRPLAATAWGTLDFYVIDPDGYILCFGGRSAETPPK